ncbi:MAG: hypothetical protein QG616_275 [Pseudomonadota bacterium]|nr:hypothetical protein [Pseudomonadota bacterium]MDQ5959042.1 hypothetical protein [Pseudomonadota bacterium]
MNKLLVALCVGVLSFGLLVGEAEAKRLGGSKSSGMQRDSVSQKQASPQPTTPTQRNAASPAAAQPAASAAQPKRNWLGPIAGLAAGLGIAALLSHFGMGEGMANFLMIALLATAAFFVIRLLFFRKPTARPEQSEPLQYAGVGGPNLSPVPLPPQSSVGGGSTGIATASGGIVNAPVARNIPPDFDVEGFLRVAKLNFVRLQAANDAHNVDDLREFLAPELFAEVKLQMDERGASMQHTDVVSLNAELLELISEPTRHVASVHFSGTISEESVAAAPFAEVWNLVKPTDGNRGWQVAGIQQLS